MSERYGHPFSAVDDQPVPDCWVAVLDRVRQEPFYRAYKARAMELLAPRLGRCYLEVGGGTGDDARELAGRLRSWAGAAHQAGLLDADEAARWPELFDEAVASGRFLYAVTFFLTAGTRPGYAGREGKR